MNAAVNAAINPPPALPDDDAGAPLRLQQAEAARLARSAGLVLVLGLAPVLAWLAFAPLSDAVVAAAFVKVDLDRRPVQHAEGGTVREVLVRDGQRVQQGQPLLVLGDVSVDADMNRLTYRVAAERASLARLEAEQMLATAIAWPADVLAAAASDARLAEHVAKEKALFAARREALVGQSVLLRSQHERVTQEREALRAQIAQAAESLRHQKAELETNRNLLQDGFISATRISQLEAGVADYGVKLEEKRSELARVEQRLTRQRPAHQVARRRLPPAGQRPVEGGQLAPVGNPAGAAQDERCVAAPGDHRAGQRRSDESEASRRPARWCRRASRSPTSCPPTRG